MIGRLQVIFLVLALSASKALPQPAPSFGETVPFVSGLEGYNTYRIPAVVRTTHGTLLAFCEGRKTSSADSGDIDIVLKRSTNNGASWLPMTLVQEEGGTASITIGNPVPVVDEITGAIHLLCCRNNDRVFHTVSTDDGVTWSARDEITAQVKLNTWGWYATGPGHGVQLKRGTQAGRLVVPSDHMTTNSVFGVQIIYSDDHGATWRLGAIQDTTNNISPNENLVVELASPASNGGARLYFNLREHGSAAGTRAQGWSTNGGSNYAGVLTNNTGFVCPTVQGSLLRLRATDEVAGTNRILFSCPNNASSRVNLSVWSSSNEAVSWGGPKAVYSGPSAYSDLVRDSNGDVGLLCEKGNASAYETITFYHFNEAWLDAPVPPPPPAEVPVPGFWNFEEKLPGQSCDTNSGAILDVSPANYANDLTAQTNLAYLAGSTNYGSGAALHFSGTGGLQLSDAASSNHFDFGSNASFTLEVVFRVATNYSSVGCLVSKDYGSKLPSWWLRVESGRARFLVADTQSEPNISSIKLVNDGNWHHVAAVRDATNPASKFLRLYLAGIRFPN
jgi:sialidase-1